MYTRLSIFGLVLIVVCTGPVQAQTPVERCAQAVDNASSNPTRECRTKLMATASRYRTDPATVIDTLVSGVKRLRSADVSASILNILSVTGLNGVVRNGRSFGTMLDLYIKHRLNGQSHEAAIENLQSS
ncbi:MAG: hypothetical protein BRD55_00860 [Bacteroidetes bacterium SW_9_63_38]|nr:MAG: hypothetical protein BRD55_00860 [Bacteroidetes bacterium SW_9_63_38]